GNQMRGGIRSDRRDRGLRKRLRRLAVDDVGSRLAEHDFPAAQYVCQNLVIVRQLQQTVPGSLINVAKIFHCLAWRGAIWLGKNHVECNGGALPLEKPNQQVCDERSRPRPLSVGAQALFIDVDDHNGADAVSTWAQRLK